MKPPRMPASLRITALLLLLATLLGACTREPPLQRHTFLGFGTLIEITLYGVEEEKAQQAISTIENEFGIMHKAWHPWEPGSLARTNQLLATGEWFSGAASVLPLVRRSQELATQSHHLFNPAIGKLVKLWGFHQTERPPEPPPAPEAIAAITDARPRMSDIEIKGITMRGHNPAVALDLGAFAKGYGIDLAIEQLKSMGIKHAIINAGGDLRAIGRHGDRPWSIGIRHPDRQGVLASVELNQDESIFTSGDYERYFEYQGRRYHHIIDPRTGYPATGSRSVTVIHSDAATADAAATALFVAGPQEWHKIARAMGIKYVLLIDTEGNAHMNPAMQKRIHFERPPKQLLISDPL